MTDDLRWSLQDFVSIFFESELRRALAACEPHIAYDQMSSMVMCWLRDNREFRLTGVDSQRPIDAPRVVLPPHVLDLAEWWFRLDIPREELRLDPIGDARATRLVNVRVENVALLPKSKTVFEQHSSESSLDAIIAQANASVATWAELLKDVAISEVCDAAAASAAPEAATSISEQNTTTVEDFVRAMSIAGETQITLEHMIAAVREQFPNDSVSTIRIAEVRGKIADEFVRKIVGHDSEATLETVTSEVRKQFDRTVIRDHGIKTIWREFGLRKRGPKPGRVKGEIHRPPDL